MDGSWGECIHLEPGSMRTCEGRPCVEESDCNSAVPTTCIDGICTDPRAACVELNDQEACDADSACTWMLPSACPEPGGPPSIAEAGCFPATNDCYNYGPPGPEICPEGYWCEGRSVAPRCSWEDPLCDACSEERLLCVPRG